MPVNPKSILDSTKKNLNIPADYREFDLDIMTHINSTFMTLSQLGIGPATGFRIEDELAEWKDLLGDDPRLEAVKTYVYLKVRLVFDPPATSFTITALEKQAEELAWRLNVAVDTPTVIVRTPIVYDPFE